MRFAPVSLVVLSALAVVSGGQSGSKPNQDKMNDSMSGWQSASTPIPVGEMTPAQKLGHFTQSSVRNTELAEKATTPLERAAHLRQAHVDKLDVFRMSDALHSGSVERRPDPDPQDPYAGLKHKLAANSHREDAKVHGEMGSGLVKEQKDPHKKLITEAYIQTVVSTHEKHAEYHDGMHRHYAGNVSGQSI